MKLTHSSQLNISSADKTTPNRNRQVRNAFYHACHVLISPNSPALDVAPTAPTAPPSPSVSSSPARLSRSQVAALIIGIFVGLLMITITGIIFVKRSRRMSLSSRGIANTFDAPPWNPESSKSGARDSLPLSPRQTVPPFQPPWNASDLNWIDRSGTHAIPFYTSF